MPLRTAELGFCIPPFKKKGWAGSATSPTCSVTAGQRGRSGLLTQLGASPSAGFRRADRQQKPGEPVLGRRPPRKRREVRARRCTAARLPSRHPHRSPLTCEDELTAGCRIHPQHVVAGGAFCLPLSSRTRPISPPTLERISSFTGVGRLTEIAVRGRAWRLPRRPLGGGRTRRPCRRARRWVRARAAGQSWVLGGSSSRVTPSTSTVFHACLSGWGGSTPGSSSPVARSTSTHCSAALSTNRRSST